MIPLRQMLDVRDRPAGAKPIGVVDIGSNSVRLVVYETLQRATTPLFNEKVLCGLGRSVASMGRLDDEAFERALMALTRFRILSDLLNVKTLRAVATAAVREASNGSEFIKHAQKICGTKIDVLSGEQEARLAAEGIMMGFVNPNGLAGDLGGGSLELIDVRSDDMAHAVTLPLGGLKLIDLTKGKPEAAKEFVDKGLDEVDWLDRGKGRTFYAVGGTWRAIAKLYMAATDYPLHVTQGFSIPPEEVIEFTQVLRKPKKFQSMPGLENISKARREVVPYGAVVFERLLARIEPSEVVFSVFGVREGILHEMLPQSERNRDPLISFCEELARLRSRSDEHGHELFAWMHPIFDRKELKESPEERRLRYAACLVSDTAWRAHPDYREEQSLSTVAYSAMSGIGHPGRMFLALSIYYRHAGSGTDQEDHLSVRLQKVLGSRACERARIIGAAVRAGHMLSAGMPKVISRTKLSLRGKVLMISIPSDLASLDGERLRRRFTTLAKLLDAEFAVRIN